MIADKIPDLKNLSAEEKVALACELWEEIEAHPERFFPVREDHIKILQERLEEYERNPQNTISWEEVKKRILNSR